MTGLQAATNDRPTRREPKGNRKAAKIAANPPVVVVTPEPHPIFGGALTVPGFELRKQPLTMLVYWLKKARAIVDQVIADGPPSDEALGEALDPFNRIYDAILSAETHSASDVERQMSAVLSYLKWFEIDDDGLSEALSQEQFRWIAANLKRATAFIQPKKQVGKLARGKKLTRAGLLFRYQCFLIEEIHTLSWEMYGDPRYALQFVTFDDAVHKALKQKKRSRRIDPFLNPTKLSARANAVLKSLKIDRVNADGRHINIGKLGGSR